MFCKKLVLIAATAALAFGSISASQQGKVHVRVHAAGLEKGLCDGQGQSPMSVEGVDGVFCVSGQACVANISNGACPGPQSGLPNGAVCGVVKTGVYGCKPAPASPTCTGNDVTPMSVEGVAGIFCVNGKACAGQDGACPGPQSGLPNGAYCGTVKTGVLGCKPKGTKHHKKHKGHKSHHASKNVCSGPGESPMSVEGVPGVFCVTGQACVADISTGACPGPQDGLPNGAHCGKVITGVYGCQPNAAAPVTQAPVTQAPVVTEAPKTEAPKTHKPKTHAPKPTANVLCSGPGQSPMSVEGVPGVFCVVGQACVADIANGACPGPQEGLPNGAYCGKVVTGVYGCKPSPSGPGTVAPPAVTHAPVVTSAPTTHAPKHQHDVTLPPLPKKTSAPGHATVIINIDVDVDTDGDDASEDSLDLIDLAALAEAAFEESEDSSDSSEERRV